MRQLFPHFQIKSHWVALFTATYLLSVHFGTTLLFSSHFPVIAGTLLFPLTFIISSLTTEHYGPLEARKLLVFSLQMTLLLGIFQFLLGFSFLPPPVIVGSLVAFAFSQLFDISFFHYLKKRLRGHFFPLRLQLSTFFSNLVDTLIVSVIVLPSQLLTFKKTLLITGNHFLYKSLISIILLLILTPMVQDESSSVS